ncbi:MAG: DUF3298 domain-containing protein [Candidatus Kapabacteria bacterium]|nr:DUF3298 domain-containing protein [Ignavibacteriota bacterium]MCW5885727.1 DUF3298 domain-containing protein [Candidatus Kapabacteria bacterium]
MKNFTKYSFFYIILVIASFLTNACSETTRQYRETRINYDSLAASIPKSDTLTILEKQQNDTNSILKYYISVIYPELIHYDNEKAQKKVNLGISGKLTEIIEMFVMDQEFMFADTTGMNLPEDFDEFESRYSFLAIDYELINNSRDLMSLILNIEKYIAFAAHPISYHKSLNFDMSSGEEIDLYNFISVNDSLFLDKLSEVSFNKITAMNLSDSVWIRNGLLPLWDNFKNYNITRDSLYLTFDVYQVAPYAVGPVRVSYSWQELIDSTRNHDEDVIIVE